MMSFPWYQGPSTTLYAYKSTVTTSDPRGEGRISSPSPGSGVEINWTAIRVAFEEWGAVYNVGVDVLSDESSLAAFGENLLSLIEMHTLATNNSRVEPNVFAAMDATKRNRLSGFVPLREEERVLRERRVPRRLVSSSSSPLSDALDWRNYGAVSDVKTQGGSCGDCFAFAATGLLEGYFATQYGILISLSEQEISDCDRVHNQGCDGGNYYYAITDYVSRAALSSAAIYPYEFETKGDCRASSRTRVLRAGGSSSPTSEEEALPIYFIERNEEALRAAVMQSPVAAAISASSALFQFYAGGVLDDAAGCGSDPDHAVLVVGYGRDEAAGLDYWLVKNSWGASWGERGYVRLKRNLSPAEMAATGGRGMCGILSQANALSGATCALSNNASLYPRECLPFESPLFCTSTWGCLASNASEFLPNGTFRIPDSSFVLIDSGGLSFASPAFAAAMAVAGVLLLGIIAALVYMRRLRGGVGGPALPRHDGDDNRVEKREREVASSLTTTTSSLTRLDRIVLLRELVSSVVGREEEEEEDVGVPAAVPSGRQKIARFRKLLGTLSPLVSDDMLRMFLEDNCEDLTGAVEAFARAGEADDSVFDCVIISGSATVSLSSSSS